MYRFFTKALSQRPAIHCLLLLNALDFATGFDLVKNKSTNVLMKARRNIYNTSHVGFKYEVVPGILYLGALW